MPATHTKRMLRVTIDLMCYDDLDLDNLDWRDLLSLEEDEDINISIQDFDDVY